MLLIILIIIINIFIYLFYFIYTWSKGLQPLAWPMKNVNKQQKKHSSNKRHTKKLKSYCPKNSVILKFFEYEVFIEI